MSSTSETTLGTPSKPISNGNPRTPLPDGPPNSASSPTITVSPRKVTPEASGVDIQVPSSIIPPESESAPVKKPARVDSHETQQPEETDEEDEDEEDEEDEDQDLPKFDWSDFEHRYTETLKSQHEEEVEIIDEFDLYATSFMVWAQAAAQRDNGRMSKRLKTRVRFTQLAEESLEDKKNHYLEVVGAFQTAMNMLRRT
ncbi:hypothetical protein ONS95_012454 [Cadophora gregata]|uniref:uncharacterized protein n=1 Tax=Cadophora gregata TaxID=51156 RepID=UPI0026DBAD7C|nr:uncharacterized protein ONS95_012454 [Cadophora gregata]KAK0118148.1 hypothetical protein ONS95_012454 [Cadophora gregata]KAK0123220.1 hypothetical protein ONS96_010220 [Cadophora gregata f. sp. sojae]